MKHNFIELRLNYAKQIPFSETPVVITRFEDFLNATTGCCIYPDTDLSEYTAEWFDIHAFVAFLLHAGSGSIRHQLEHIDIKNQIMKIGINTLIPTIGTCDMASWLALVPVKKSDLEHVAVIDIVTTNKYQ